MSNCIQVHTITQQQLSNAGKARAAKLSPERRSEIAKKANMAKKCNHGIPKATHQGKLKVDELEIDCAVLENGERVISLSAFNAALGRKSKNPSKTYRGTALLLPAFLTSENLQDFFDEQLVQQAQPIIFIGKSGKTYGFKAELFPKVCQIYIDARNAGKVSTSQLNIVRSCEILLISFAQVGIAGLIDEATCYQKYREKDELQKLFSKFIAQELQPWVKRFPDAFFHHLKRMYGLDEMKRTPKFVGHLINRWIYRELSPEIHEELKRLNPITENGNRSTQHHRLLTQDIGCPALDKQIQKVTTLLSVSDNKEEFEKFLEKSKV